MNNMEIPKNLLEEEQELAQRQEIFDKYGNADVVIKSRTLGKKVLGKVSLDAPVGKVRVDYSSGDGKPLSKIVSIKDFLEWQEENLESVADSKEKSDIETSSLEVAKMNAKLKEDAEKEEQKEIEKAEEIKNNLLRENFVRTQLELENLRKSTGFGKGTYNQDTYEAQKKYDEAKKTYYEFLKNKEGSGVEQKSKFVSEEFNKLQDIKIDLRSKEEINKAHFPINKIKEIGDWYRKQPMKQKMIVAAALFGGGIMAGMTGGAGLGLVVGVMATVSRALSGAGTAIAAETVIKEGGTIFGKRFEGHKDVLNKKSAEEIEKIKNGLSVESASKFFEENEEALAGVSEKLYKKSKSLETERALVAGALGTVIGTGAFGNAIKNVMHETGMIENIKKATTTAWDSLKGYFSGLGGYEVVKNASVVGGSHVTPYLEQTVSNVKETIKATEIIDNGHPTPNLTEQPQSVPDVRETARVVDTVTPSPDETQHFIGEIKAGGDVDHTAFEVGDQAGATHDQVREALKNTTVTDIHGNKIPLIDAELVQPGVKMEFVPGTESQPTHFIVTEPNGVGSGGFANDEDYMKMIHKTFPMEAETPKVDDIQSKIISEEKPEIISSDKVQNDTEIKPEENNFAVKVANIEAQYNEDNSFLLDGVPSELKESIIDSNKVMDVDYIDKDFAKLDIEHQKNVLDFLLGRVENANENDIGVTATLSEKLYEHLSNNSSYLKNIESFDVTNKVTEQAVESFGIKTELHNSVDTDLNLYHSKLDLNQDESKFFEKNPMESHVEKIDAHPEDMPVIRGNKEIFTIDKDSQITFKIKNGELFSPRISGNLKGFTGKGILKDTWFETLALESESTRSLALSKNAIQAEAGNIYLIKKALNKLAELGLNNGKEAKLLKETLSNSVKLLKSKYGDIIDESVLKSNK